MHIFIYANMLGTSRTHMHMHIAHAHDLRSVRLTDGGTMLHARAPNHVSPSLHADDCVCLHSIEAFQCSLRLIGIVRS